VNKKLKRLKEALYDLNKACQCRPNDSITLQQRGDVKRLLGDIKGALEDLNKAAVDSFTLKTRGAVKIMLDELEGALPDLNKADTFGAL